jgi:hypothetical protein
MKGGDLIIGYFENLGIEFLNKYKITFYKKLWIYFSIYKLIFHREPLKFYIIYNDYNIMIFNGLSIDNEIT